MRFSLIRCASLFVVFASLTLLAAEEQPEKGKGKKDKGKSEPEIVQVDLSKLPPDVAKMIRDQNAPVKEEKGKDKKDKKDKKDGKGEKAPKMISLIDAIGIAEKSGFGAAVKAERKGEPGEYHFKVDVLDSTGVKTKIKLDDTGKVLETETKKGDDKKGKGKDKK